MTRDVLEVEVDKVVDAMDILLRNGIDAAIFGSVLHVTVEDVRTGNARISRSSSIGIP